MKTIGVIGGLGPMATAYYLELLATMTDAATDQEHPPILLVSVPETPDRTAYILGREKKDPMPSLLRAAKWLEQSGADFITIACVTAHYFCAKLQQNLHIPILSPLEIMARQMHDCGITCAGILATSGTLAAGLMQNAFAAQGIRTVTPDEEMQGQLMALIYGQLKSGKNISQETSVETTSAGTMEQFVRIADALRRKGAQRLVLGCTELSLLKKGGTLSADYVDVLEVLAQQAVLRSGAALRREYR